VAASEASIRYTCIRRLGDVRRRGSWCFETMLCSASCVELLAGWPARESKVRSWPQRQCSAMDRGQVQLHGEIPARRCVRAFDSVGAAREGYYRSR